MFLNALASVSTAFRTSTRSLRPIVAQTPRLTAPLPSPIQASTLSLRYSSHVALENLAPPPGSSKNKRRVGRGVGSKRGGHTSGRGHKGAKARGTGNPYEGFEGGQTPLYRRIPKRGFINVFKKEYCPLNIATVQRWIQDNRFDPSTPLTIQQAVHTNMVHGLSNWNGIKLVGSPTRSMPLPPLTVHLSRFSEKAGKAVIAAGGSCLSVYHNRLSLRQEVYPEKFKGREVKPAGPTRRPDIEFYTNPDKFGYLAEKKEEFFRERGWEPDSKKRRAMRERARASKMGVVAQPEMAAPLEAEAAAQ